MFWCLGDFDHIAEIELFSIYHILYAVVIFGVCILAALLLNRKSEQTKDKALRVIAGLIATVYFGDFFFHPFVYDGLNLDKMPFHLCTVLCPMILLAQFGKRIKKWKEPVAVFAIVAPLMYICYPGSALGGVAPWCYKVVQTFTYHGLLLLWGFLMLTTKRVVLKWKNLWRALVGIILMVCWASLGNTLYTSEAHHYDWFFLTGSTFPFIPSSLMPFVVIALVFAMCATIYGIYFLVLRHCNKPKKSHH